MLVIGRSYWVVPIQEDVNTEAGRKLAEETTEKFSVTTDEAITGDGEETETETGTVVRTELELETTAGTKLIV